MTAICLKCNQSIEPADEHWLHDVDCDDPDGCTCDLYAHPRCCPSCNPPECEGQLSIEGVRA